jgi:hypothetical protein
VPSESTRAVNLPSSRSVCRAVTVSFQDPLNAVFTFTLTDGKEETRLFKADSWDRDEAFAEPGEQASLPLSMQLRLARLSPG